MVPWGKNYPKLPQVPQSYIIVILQFTKMDIYDHDQIITNVLRCGVNISPTDRQEWVLFCHALKVLGYDETTFAALSYCPENESKRVWRNEKRTRMTQDQAKGKIIALAKEAGVDVKQFLLRPYTNFTPSYPKLPQVPQVPQEPKSSAPDTSTPPPVFIPMEEVRAAAGAVDRSTLFRYLCGLFPIDEVKRVCLEYHVGATAEFGEVPALASAFPYINAGGQCVDVHLQPYEEDGHRWRQDRHRYFQNWLLAKRKQSDRRAPWPLFGEHLLNVRLSAPVGVVESEKTALICSIAAPRYVWTATGSLANLNARRCAAIRRRAVYVFPDNDGLSQWEAKAADLAKDGFNVFFCGQYIADHAAPGSKEDVADIIISNLKTSTNGTK